MNQRKFCTEKLSWLGNQGNIAAPVVKNRRKPGYVIMPGCFIQHIEKAVADPEVDKQQNKLVRHPLEGLEVDGASYASAARKEAFQPG